MCYYWTLTVVFRSALCYCTTELLSWRGRLRPSVDIVFSETVKWIHTKFWLQVYLSTISPQTSFFLKILNFWFFTIFFRWHMTIWEKKFQTPLKVRIRYTPKNHAYSWGGSLPKLPKDVWNFKFWIFAIFFFIFANMGPYMYGSKVSNDISSEITHQICQNSWILLGRDSVKVVKRIVKFEILAIFVLFLFLAV